MPAPHKAALAAVAVLVVLGVAVVGLGVAGSPDGAVSGSPTVAPSVSATTSETARETAATSAGPSAPGDEETLAIVREIEEQVIAIRGLPAADIGPPELLNREQLGEELEQLFAEDYPPEEQRRDNITLRALGLLEPDQDVAELQLQLLSGQVLGFYDDVEKRMVIVTEGGFDAAAKFTYAHEYTHALQDAAFGLDSLDRDAVGEDDRGLARTALIEGDATITMVAWAFQHLSQEELLELGTGLQLPDTAGIPSWMIRLLEFPYTEGSIWAGGLAAPAGDPTAADFAQIDAAYANPPDTTEQIIDIDKWLTREDPIVVEMPDLAARLGDDWEEVDATPIGQATIRIMLEHLGVDADTAFTASSGWGGDRAVVTAGPDEAFAVAWRLAWDSPADATQFLEAYRLAVEALPFPATVLEVTGGQILVAHASSEDLLRRTVDAAND